MILKKRLLFQCMNQTILFMLFNTCICKGMSIYCLPNTAAMKPDQNFRLNFYCNKMKKYSVFLVRLRLAAGPNILDCRSSWYLDEFLNYSRSILSSASDHLRNILGDFEQQYDQMKVNFVFGFKPFFLLGDFEQQYDQIKINFVFGFKPSFLLDVFEQQYTNK